MGCVASGIVSVELQRHERSPNTMDVSFTYRSVFDFEKGLESEALVFEHEAMTPGDDAAPVVGDTAEGFEGDDAEGFTEAAARCMAARPLALVT
jgi:hypothetical protein